MSDQLWNIETVFKIILIDFKKKWEKKSPNSIEDTLAAKEIKNTGNPKSQAILYITTITGYEFLGFFFYSKLEGKKIHKSLSSHVDI